MFKNPEYKPEHKKLGFIFSILVIFIFYFIAIFADFLSPYSPTDTGAHISYSQPSSIKFNTLDFFYFHPLELTVNKNNFDRNFQENKNIICQIGLLQKGFEYKFLGLIKTNIHLFGIKKIKTKINNINNNNLNYNFHLLGTDKLGRDLFSRLLYGLRPGLFAGFLGIIISFFIGVLYGSIAGYYKNTLGDFMMRIVEVILSFPSFYLLIILAGLLPASMKNFDRLILITVILSLIGWAGLARVIRGQVLSLTEREFVKSAVLFGFSDFKILFREIIPQLSSYLIISFTISFPAYIMGEASLSFLGLGINQPDPSLGNILAEGRELSNLFFRPWISLLPVIILMSLAWSCNSLGDYLRNIFDPKNY